MIMCAASDIHVYRCPEYKQQANKDYGTAHAAACVRVRVCR